MDNQQWTDERLNQLASLAESNLRAIQALAEGTAEARETNQRQDHPLETIEQLVESNAWVIQALANTAAESREERDELLRRMDQQQAEIRGMQLENRRILDIWFNQLNLDDPPSA